MQHFGAGTGSLALVTPESWRACFVCGQDIPRTLGGHELAIHGTVAAEDLQAVCALLIHGKREKGLPDISKVSSDIQMSTPHRRQVLCTPSIAEHNAAMPRPTKLERLSSGWETHARLEKQGFESDSSPSHQLETSESCSAGSKTSHNLERSFEENFGTCADHRPCSAKFGGRAASHLLTTRSTTQSIQSAKPFKPGPAQQRTWHGREYEGVGGFLRSVSRRLREDMPFANQVLGSSQCESIATKAGVCVSVNAGLDLTDWSANPTADTPAQSSAQFRRTADDSQASASSLDCKEKFWQGEVDCRAPFRSFAMLRKDVACQSLKPVTSFSEASTAMRSVSSNFVDREGGFLTETQALWSDGTLGGSVTPRLCRVCSNGAEQPSKSKGLAALFEKWEKRKKASGSHFNPGTSKAQREDSRPHPEAMLARERSFALVCAPKLRRSDKRGLAANATRDLNDTHSPASRASTATDTPTAAGVGRWMMNVATAMTHAKGSRNACIFSRRRAQGEKNGQLESPGREADLLELKRKMRLTRRLRKRVPDMYSEKMLHLLVGLLTEVRFSCSQRHL